MTLVPKREDLGERLAILDDVMVDAHQLIGRELREILFE